MEISQVNDSTRYSDDNGSTFHLYKKLLVIRNLPNDGGEVATLIQLPDWLADGIRKLVKDKIEEENSKGA